MPDLDGLQQQTLDTEDNSSPNPEVENSTSNSQDALPKEYERYKDVLPWGELPDEVRTTALEGIKKLHGDFTRGQQESAKKTAHLQEKSEFLDYLNQQPEIQKALQSIQTRGQGGQNQQSAQEAATSLSDYGFEPDAQKAIGALIQKEIGNAMSPLNGQLSNMQQQMAEQDAKKQLADVTSWAESKGLPNPNDMLSSIREKVSSQRATTVMDAYILAIKDDLPGIYQKQAEANLQTKMQKKAELTPPPGRGPSVTPLRRDSSGTDAIESALAAAEADLGIKL
ncbi:MAG: hypothetical protein U9M89_02835 [Patescibacteria group bacterium]|nr:hypothetical protein [Patescibacteria group bacterium]